ncbi:hypothetical protein, partial [Priestia megaterium]|uniref:hypothetical protein n=1 Tax=Priestia megaterium TaxID=1404 RepID=UPI0035B57BED
AAERLQYEGYLHREETNAVILGLSKDGVAIKEIVRRTGWADCGLVPWLAAARGLPAEDAVALDRTTLGAPRRGRIAVPKHYIAREH